MFHGKVNLRTGGARRCLCVRLVRASFFLAFIFCVVNLSGAVAQQSVTSATLGGRVEDERGAGVGGAHVVATNLDTQQQRTTTSDEHGRYRFLSLPVGNYQLAAERAGFAPVKRKLTLTVGQALDAPLQLAVAGVAESVSVMESDVPVVEIARTQVAETILPRDTDSLPLNGRNYLDLALLVPGVSRTNTGSNQRFAETSAVPGTGLSVAGQRNLNNSFVLDGLSANDDAADLAGTFYSQEVIREFQVITSGGITEFGRSSGGVVNIITQSGTNKLAGRLYGFARNQRFDARNPLAPQRDPLTQAQYGATLGGPLKQNRAFFFTNFEQTRRNDAGVITITPANAAAINARLDAISYAGERLQTGIFPSGFDSTNFFGRLDHELSSAQRLSARYSFYDITSTNARSVGGLNAVSRGSALDNRDQTFALSYLATPSTNTLNEARFQFTRSRLSAPVNDGTGAPAVNIAGVANFGAATFSPLARALDVFEATDAFTTQRGAHTLKAGAQFLLNRTDILFPGAREGVYTFSSLANFQAGRYITFQQAFGAPSQFQSNPNLGLFAQDEWRVRTNLTVNAGVRYDAQFLPAPIETDTDNFAPRLGIAYAPGGDDHRTVLRASVGLYFDRLPLRATSNALQRDGLKYKVAVLAFGQSGAPAFPQTLDAFPSGLLTAITTIDPEIENSYSRQASLQLERELPLAGASLSVGYLHLRARHLVLSRNVNVPTLTAAEAASRGDANLGRPDPRFANVSRFESSGESQYDALTVSLNKRAARAGVSLRLSYTLSKAIDTAGNFFFSTPQDNFNLRDERGLSDNDQRHRLTLSGSFEASAKATGNASAFRRAAQGFKLSYIFTYASALPFNIQTGTDRNNDTNANDRPAGVGRNTGRGFDFASLDLRLSRKFKLTERVRLEALAEGFNVFNRANLQLPNNIFGTGLAPRAGFGQPTAAADPRQLQFGLRLDF
ncbi:MAG TPA: carboxypeptidase regulatory-like domain-containing protein [Pyrinomonadaceae bacterium]|nr:carboxypeptidase regulatory-like domain-containing protein [Pyrinomonadaceae bacterium]